LVSLVAALSPLGRGRSTGLAGGEGIE